MHQVSHAHFASSRKFTTAIALAAATAAASLLPATAHAQTLVTWVAGTGDYNTPTNWSPNVTPANANNEVLLINNGGTAQVAAGGEGAWLYLGLRPGDTGHLQVSGGTLTLGELRVGGRETLPDFLGGTSNPNAGGTGSVVQSGGTVSITYSTGTEPPIQSLYIGDAGDTTNSASGSYTLTAGTLISGIAGDDAIVVGTGAGTRGTFIQQGGDVTSTGFITVGRRGATATWTISGGTLRQLGTGSGSGLFIGDGDAAGDTATSATFTQTGGAITLSSGVQIGRRSGTGRYDMSGGSLTTAGEIIVGGGPPGTTAEALLKGTGTFNLSGSAAVSIGTNMNLGLAPGGAGTTTSPITGTLNMTGGSITFNAANAIFALGNGRGVVGTANHSAGTLAMTGATANLHLGRNGGSATYNLSGTGVVNVTTLTIESSVPIGNPSRIFNMTGGTLNATTVNFGSAASAGSTRQLNISNGTATIGSITTGSNGFIDITGGSVAINTQISLSSGSTVRTTIPLTWNAAIALGNGTLQVDNSTLSLTGAISSPTLGRTLTKTGTGTLVLSGPWTYTTSVANPNNNSTIAANAGTTNINVDLNGATETNSMTVNAAAGATVNFGTSQNVRNVTSSGNITLTPGGNKTLNVTNNLSITGGTVDITNNTLTVPVATTSVDTVRGYLQSAFNNGAWTGPGLTSSTARDRADNATGLGYSSDGTTLNVLYTWAGDLNLDKKVNGDDFTLIDRHVAINGLNSAGTWTTGDVNYDGLVGTADYMLIDTSYAATGVPLSPAFLAMREAQFGPGYVAALTAAVPEPAALGAAALSSLALFRRRRRQK